MSAPFDSAQGAEGSVLHNEIEVTEQFHKAH